MGHARGPSDRPPRRGRLPPQSPHRLLPPAPGDPAPDLVLPLDGGDRLRLDRELADLDLHLPAGRPPAGLPRFMCSYVRYQAHLGAYLALIGNPYPAFTGAAGEYPIDIRLPEEPVRQRRWTIFVRIFIAVPALIVSAALAGSPGGNLSSSAGGSNRRT